MAVANGFGKVVTSGSVFMYDTGDTVNSYIGEPTTNYQWNSGYEVTPWTVGGINTDVTNTVDQGPIKGAKTWKFQKTGTSNQWNGWESSYGGIWTGNAGDIWTTSYWYKATTDAGLGGFQVGAFYLPDWSRPYNATVLANVSNIIADGQWHYNYTVTQINENYSNAIIVDGPAWGYSGNSGTLFINGLQWEKKPHPTPFAYGTRSVTQGLLPIVGNSTINLASVSFDSNAQLDFDGTDDRILLTNFTTKPTTAITCETIIKPTRPSVGTGTIRGGAISATNTMYLGIIDSVDGGNTFAMHWANQTNSSRVYNWNGQIPNNAFSHLVGTYDGQTSRAYLNGVEIWSTSQTGTIPDADYYIGTYGGAPVDGVHNFNGYIPIAKIYNRALSAAEVKQNYNKYKTRFNLP
jgi:hypothetical protein